MIYKLTENDAKELTDQELDARLCAYLNDIRLKRVKVQEVSLETQDAEVMIHEKERRRAGKEQKAETPLLVNMYPPE